MTTVQILKKARQLVTKGWIQKYYKKRVGNQPCYCAIGAVRQADPLLGAQAGCALYDALPPKARTGFWHRAVIDWNDAQGRTKDQVIRLFTRAIEREEKAAKAAKAA